MVPWSLRMQSSAMSKNSTQEQSSSQWGKKIYEMGFLLLPTLSEEAVSTEAAEIKSIIEKAEGEYITQDAPTLITLAYSMTTGTTGHKRSFDKAYFGWIKFQASGTAVEFIKRKYKEMPNFLRFIIIQSVKDTGSSSTKLSLKTAVTDAVKVMVDENSVNSSPKASIDEVQLNKSIEQLIV